MQILGFSLPSLSPFPMQIPPDSKILSGDSYVF